MTTVAQQLAAMPALLTCRQLATILGVTPHSVRRWAREGKIPHLRVAGIRFAKDRVLDWLRQREVQCYRLPQ